ncbi:MAG: hypothetical protein ACKVU1_03955 [bacterium]
MNYYIAKAAVRLQNLLAPRNACGGTVVANAPRPLAGYDGVLFFFDEPLFMHYGDQLWFKPLVEKLAGAGIRVAVRPTKQIAFLFARHLDNGARDVSRHLIVSRTDLLPRVRREFGLAQEYFLFDTNSTRIRRPMSNHIVDSFSQHFDLDLPQNIVRSDYIDFDVDGADRFALASHPRVLVLNNYVDSGRHRVTHRMGRRLQDALRARKAGAFVVHLGSSRDAARDRADYSGLVDLDLRGRTSIEDLFSILALPNIARVFCHDTLVLHIANLYDRAVSVVFRRYFRPGENEQKRHACASLFEKDRANIEFLD